MSTQPSEAHLNLADEIYRAMHGKSVFGWWRHAAQLISDSEARAVEARDKEIAELKKCIEDLYHQAHETVKFTDSNEMSMDMEISAAFGILASHRDEAESALTAEREKVRVLREALRSLLPYAHMLLRGESPISAYADVLPFIIADAESALSNPKLTGAKRPV